MNYYEVALITVSYFLGYGMCFFWHRKAIFNYDD